MKHLRSLPKQPFAFFIFYSAFLLNDQQEPAARSLQFYCYALMMILGVIETFAICHLDLRYILYRLVFVPFTKFGRIKPSYEVVGCL